MRDRDTPLKFIRLIQKRFPGCFDVLDDCIETSRAQGFHWPDYCDIPLLGGMYYLATSSDCSDPAALARSAPSNDAIAITAAYIWRKTKMVYTFDPDLSEALLDQADEVEVGESVPTELLLHPPFPCVYIKLRTGAPELDNLDGFFYWVEYNIYKKQSEARILLLSRDMTVSAPRVLHLIPGGTLYDCLSSTITETMRHSPDSAEAREKAIVDANFAFAACQFILYIISANADVEVVSAPAAPRRTEAPARSKTSEDKASQVTEHAVGIRVGAALRSQRKRYLSSGSSTGTGTTKRSHLRRGHWHSYWTGPLGGDRNLIIKWTAPTVIHPEAGTADEVTVRPVKPK